MQRPYTTVNACILTTNQKVAGSSPAERATQIRTMLGELLDHMEGAQEVASGIAHEYPEYEAMAEAVSNATEMVAMARELEAHDQREDDYR